MKASIYAFLGNLYLIKFQKDKAMKCFKKAIERNTKNVLAIYNYGLVLLQDGFAKEALEYFFLANRINKSKIKKKSFRPDYLNRNILLDKNIPLAMSSCYWRLNEIDKAIDILEGLRRKYNYLSPNTLTTLGYFYLLNKNYEKATQISQMAIDDTENFSAAWDNLGQIYFEQKDMQKAKVKFLKSIEYNPNSVDSLYHLGLIEEIDGNKDKAIEYFEKALTCNITFLNTVSKEELEKKLKEIKNL